ncbi:MAG: hypothetical protein ACI9LM_003972 [Alteromonadaceae bacterium]|jgi:hypothetical protein
MSAYATYYILKILIPVTIQSIKFNRKKPRLVNVAVFLIWRVECELFPILCLRRYTDLFQLQP